ncbi:MAG: hypothetical protein ACSHX6_08520 [Akkermansiaceae bacterium]
MWTKRQAIREADQAVNEYQSQAEEYRAEIAQLMGERDQYQLEVQGARLELVAGLLGGKLDEGKLEQLSREWGVSHLAGLYESLLAKRKLKLSERDELKGHEVIQGRYELLEADSARYVEGVCDAKDELGEEESKLGDYEAVEFQWLYERGCHELRVDSGLKKLWKVITFQAAKEKKYRVRVAGLFQERSLRSVADSYEAILEEVRGLKERLLITEKVRDEAVELVRHFDELNGWEFNFEGIVREHAEKIFGDYFQTLGPDAILARVPDEFRVLAAKVHAVSKKYDYASNLISYLESEEEDRNQRVQSINRVSQKWRRNPSGRVRGDKSKWLQQIPAMKKEGAQKRLGWSRRMRSSLFYYDDYRGYGSYYYFASHHRVTGFLAYDVFNHRTAERMPHEGFSREVIPEIEEFREENVSGEWLKELEEEKERWSGGEGGLDSAGFDVEEGTESMQDNEGGDAGVSAGVAAGAMVGAAVGAIAVADMMEQEIEDEAGAIESLIEDDEAAAEEIGDES